MSTTAAPTGFRRDIVFLRDLSEVMEKNPATERPAVRLGGTIDLSWYINWGYDYKNIIPAGHPDRENWWRIEDTEMAVLKREYLESKIAAIIDAFAGVEWEKNDPDQDAYSYTLTGQWQGARLHISTRREDVCEKVVVLETEHEEEVPDPDIKEKVLQAIPLVKVMVKDTITEWQCNAALAEKTAPMHSRTVVPA